MADIGDQITQLFGQSSGEPGDPNTLNTVMQGAKDFLGSFRAPDFGGMARQGLNDYADALSGEDVQGNPVPTGRRAMTLLGSALPNSIAARGLSQTERMLSEGKQAAGGFEDWDQVPFKHTELPAVEPRDVYGMDGPGYSTDTLTNNYGLNSSISHSEYTAKDIAGGMRRISEITGLPEDAMGMRGKLNIYGDVDPLPYTPGGAAHYSPNTSTIAMRPGYEGTLGHEYGHALDNYFGRYFSVGSNSELSGLDVGKLADSKYSMAHMASQDPMMMRNALQDKFDNVMAIVEDPEYRQKSMAGDFLSGMKKGVHPDDVQDYLVRPQERLARAFEYYLYLKNGGKDIPGLTSIEPWRKAATIDYGKLEHPLYPLPSSDDGKVVKAFDEFFKEIKTRTATRDDGKRVTEMYTGANPLNAPKKDEDQ